MHADGLVLPAFDGANGAAGAVFSGQKDVNILVMGILVWKGHRCLFKVRTIAMSPPSVLRAAVLVTDWTLLGCAVK